MELNLREKFRIAQDVLEACAEVADDTHQVHDLYVLEAASGAIARLMYKVEDNGTANNLLS